jgi:hypothetical protein
MYDLIFYFNQNKRFDLIQQLEYRLVFCFIAMVNVFCL